MSKLLKNIGIGYDKKQKGPTTPSNTSNSVIMDDGSLEDIPEEESIIHAYNDVDHTDLSSMFECLSICIISLSLRHLELIDWDLCDNTPINMFVDTYVNLMGLGEDEHSSCKNKNKKNKKWSSSENLPEALPDLEKVKIKDASNGENLEEALEDGDVHLPLVGTQLSTRSSILIEETQEVNLGTAENPKITYVAKSLSDPEYAVIVQLLQEGVVNFAWSYSDMPGLDPTLVVHHLDVRPNAKPVKQKLHKMHPQVALLVKKELEKLLDAGFIKKIDYSDWISNIVPVAKPNGDIQIYTNFKDLSKACPKDDFPLLNIDMLVDLIARHEMLSLMDGFLGYNQIEIAPEDQHNTAFTTPWGTFCYNVMPFGIKNAGVTYQRAMTVIFHDLIHIIMEDYVDDLLEKSRTQAENPTILKKIFEQLEHYKLWLNPKKVLHQKNCWVLQSFEGVLKLIPPR